MKKILFLIFAALATWSLGAEIMVYENDFESYMLGEVRIPVQDAWPFMESNTTNLLFCNVEADCGFEASQGVHCFILEENGKSATGGAQFDLGLGEDVFRQECEVIYEVAWRGTNLASMDLTDGTNLFFRLFSNGTTARRVGVTNLTDAAFVELKGEDDDPSRVTFSPRYGFYRIHVLFPEGRISLIERDFEGENSECPQTGLYGMPGVLPTHFGGGIMSQHYAVKDRHCYFDNILVSVIPEPASLGLLALLGLFFAGKERFYHPA